MNSSDFRTFGPRRLHICLKHYHVCFKKVVQINFSIQNQLFRKNAPCCAKSTISREGALFHPNVSFLPQSAFWG